MIIEERRKDVAELILKAAKNSSTVAYGTLLSLFTRKQIEDKSAFQTLEEACKDLAARKEAIYDAVMAKADTGLPGDGFFDVYRNHRPAEYRSIAGTTMIQELTPLQKQQIVKLERDRVYNHAR